jgi:hypothetical protein
MNINICGRREEGKTTLAMYVAAQRHKGVVAFDPRGMIEGVVVWGPDDLERAIQERVWEDGPIVYRFDSTDPDEDFSAVTTVLFPPRFTRGGFAFVIDEAGLLQGSNNINAELLRIIKQHPTKPQRERVTIVQTNHTLYEFHRGSKSLMDELYMFQLTHYRDLEAVAEHTGSDELAEQVGGLPPHHAVRFFYGRQAEGKQQWELWDKPEAWHIRATNTDLGPGENKTLTDSKDSGIVTIDTVKVI